MRFYDGTPHDSGEYVDFFPDDAGSAAISVGVMLASAVIFLAILKRSGFRAMVAVGRS